jgi:hypothetical protein
VSLSGTGFLQRVYKFYPNLPGLDDIYLELEKNQRTEVKTMKGLLRERAQIQVAGWRAFAGCYGV